MIRMALRVVRALWWAFAFDSDEDVCPVLLPAIAKYQGQRDFARRRGPAKWYDEPNVQRLDVTRTWEGNGELTQAWYQCLG